MLSGKLSPAFERNNVPVVIAATNLYAPYAGVFIRSLLDHASAENNYDIIVFEREISKENKRLLKGLAAGHTNVSIRFYDPSPFFASRNFIYDDDKRYPIEVYYKIAAPHILNYPGRIITVDADTLLLTDIARLMDEDLEGCSVGAVVDLAMYGMYLCDHTWFSENMKARDYVKNVLGWKEDDLKGYVNTGLLTFDCGKYVRELNIEAMINTARQGRYAFPDQDTLNVLMKGKIRLLDFAWNIYVQSNPRVMKCLDAASKKFGGDYERAYEAPHLLHLAAPPKPWVCPDVPYGGEWWQTALRTPFVGHIIARMMDEQEKRRAYYRERYGKENVDIWDPSPKGIDRV